MPPRRDLRQTSFALQLTLFSTALITLCVGVCSALVYVQVRADLKASVGGSLLAMARSAAPLVDGDTLAFIYRDEDGAISEPEEFEAIRAKLSAVRTANELAQAVEILRAAPDQGDVVRELEFVVMTNRDEKGEFYVGNLYGAWAHHRTALGGAATVTDIYEDEHGVWMFAGAYVTGALVHSRGLSGSDIGDPDFVFTELKEVWTNAEVGVGYVHAASGIGAGVTYAQTLSGRNTGQKQIFSASLSWDH